MMLKRFNFKAGKHLEREIVKKLGRAINRKARQEGLINLKFHVNLATNPYKVIWSPWYSTKIPPRLEVDLILILQEPGLLEKSLMVAVEVEYFNTPRKRFYDGIDQVLAFSLLGFDGVALWHIFSKKVRDTDVKKRAEAVLEMVKGFELPIFYVAFRLEDATRIICLSPLELSGSFETDQLVKYILSYFANGKHRNPLLSKHEVIKRRNTLKVLFGIPVS